MDEIFGVSMTSITAVLVGLLLFALLCVGLVALRKPVVFKLGARNIPRRKAQTVLIVIGLMLSTLIVAAALGLGDTFAFSLTRGSYDASGHVDQIAVTSVGGDPDDFTEYIELNARQAADVVPIIQANDKVDGVLPFFRIYVPAINEAEQLGEPVVNLVGLDPAQLPGFEDDLRTKDGERIDLAAVAPGEVIANEALAEELDIEAGDTITIYHAERPHQLLVKEVARSTLLTGRTDASSELDAGAVMPLSQLRELAGDADGITAVAISLDGGIRSNLELADETQDEFRSELRGLNVGIINFKKEQVDLSILIANVFTSLFLVLGLFSIGVGVLLIVLIFTMLAAERRPEMGMARAVGQRRRQLVQQFVSEGTTYALMAGGLGVVLGIVATFIIAAIVNNLFGEFFPISAQVSARSLAAAFALGVVITFLSVVAASIKISRMNVVAAIRDIPDVTSPKRRLRTLVYALLLLLIGGGMTMIGVNAEQQAPFGIGMTVWPFGIALILRFFGVPSRPIFSLIGVWILFFWLLPDRQFKQIFGEFDADIEMFFVSGICMVIGATILIVQNTDVLLALVSLLGRIFRSKLPAVRTAVAYPGSARGRTGMTIAMFSLVIFSLIMIATLNANFSKIFINDDATAGWDIRVDVGESNPIPDLRATLDENGVDVSQIGAIGRVRLPTTNGREYARSPEQSSFNFENVSALDAAFLDSATLEFEHRAAGYESDAAVIEALKSDPAVAVVTSDGANEEVLRISPEDDGFDPIPIQIRNSSTGETADLSVIAVIDPKISTLFGIYTGDAGLATIFPEMKGAQWYIKAAAGADAERLSDRIETVLLRYGADTSPIREELEEAERINNGFFYLIQGFMGLGLIVGVAAIGVVSFRSVVERRQQIGVLRAIGFQREMVSLSFLIESAFVVGIGAITGTVLGLALAYNLLHSEDVEATGSFVIPWGLVLSIFFGTMGVALLMSWVPSRQAASIAPAEALRYE
jgi:putative ABC transport system permease protein